MAVVKKSAALPSCQLRWKLVTWGARLFSPNERIAALAEVVIYD